MNRTNSIRKHDRKKVGKNPLLDTGKFENTDTKDQMKIYMALDDQRYSAMQEVLEGISESLEDIHKRLFVDNGNPSIQTTIADHTMKIKWLMAWAAVITLSIGGIAFKVIETKVTDTEDVANIPDVKIRKCSDDSEHNTK